MTILYNFSTDYILREQYRDAWNEVRIGKLLEDLDALVGTISVKHYSDDDNSTRPLYLVTASVDKILLKKPISVFADLRIDGAVTWVGHSSIRIQLDVSQTSLADPSDSTALIANFVYVARDYKTGKAALVNRITPGTEREKLLYKAAEANTSKVRKRKERDEDREIENGERVRFEALLAQGRIF